MLTLSCARFGLIGHERYESNIAPTQLLTAEDDSLAKVAETMVDGANASGPFTACPLPPLYYINLDEDADRNANMKRQLVNVNSHSTRIRATTKVEVKQALHSGLLSLEGGVRVYNDSMVFPAGAGVDIEHADGIYTLGELACTISHLRAIKQAFDDGAMTALITEDDISFRYYYNDWVASLQQLAVAAPADWEVLQLHTNNPLFYTGYAANSSCGVYANASGEHWMPWDVSHWGTLAYVISRPGMRRLLDRTANASILPRMLSADQFVYTYGSAYTLTTPLFVNVNSFSTSVQDDGTAKTDGNGPVTDSTDGPTDAFVEEFFTKRGLGAAKGAVAGYATGKATGKATKDSFVADCRPAAARKLAISVITTTTAGSADVQRHLSNAELAATVESTVWAYGINAIDNDVAPWEAARPAFVRQGVLLVVRASNRPYPLFQSKLIGSLALLDALDLIFPSSYVWIMDGDISFQPTDLIKMAQYLTTAPYPVIAQPTVNTPWDVADTDAAVAAAMEGYPDATPYPWGGSVTATSLLSLLSGHGSGHGSGVSHGSGGRHGHPHGHHHKSHGWWPYAPSSSSTPSAPAPPDVCVPFYVNTTCEVEILTANASETLARAEMRCKLDQTEMLYQSLIHNLSASNASIVRMGFRMEGHQKLANVSLRYPWGTQWFIPLNANRTKACGMEKTPVPFVESQTPILSAAFLKWYRPTLRRIAQIQSVVSSDYGMDSMWCNGAKAWLKAERSDSISDFDPCQLWANITVEHDDARSIQEGSPDFICSSAYVVKTLEASEPNFVPTDDLNAWWNVSNRCAMVKRDRDAVVSYREFVESYNATSGV